MTSIGIIGTGISGLTLALTLQQHGVECVVYADRTSDEIRDGRLPNTVVRYGGTIPRERALGVNHWDGADLVIERAYIGTRAPIVFGPMPNGGNGRLPCLPSSAAPGHREPWWIRRLRTGDSSWRS
jgi:hypothetical protein